MPIKMLPRLLGIVLILVAPFAASCGGSTPESTQAPQATETADTPEPITGQQPTGWAQLSTQIGGEKELKWNEPPKMMIDTGKQYRAIMETEKGTLVLELFTKDVPVTVNNFVFLVSQGYYDGTTFHRVMPGFMVQGGDPTGTGIGGPGYRFEDEFTEHKHGTGTLSMANSGSNTNGSQFFITYEPTPWLDGHHTIFGQLVEGMDVLESLTPRDPTTNPQFEGDKLLSVRIEVKEGSQ